MLSSDVLIVEGFPTTGQKESIKKACQPRTPCDFSRDLVRQPRLCLTKPVCIRTLDRIGFEIG